MGRVSAPLAACAIALVMLAGASNTIVAADDDTTASDSADSNASTAGASSAGTAAAPDPPQKTADVETRAEGQPLSGTADDDTNPDEPGEKPGEPREESSEERAADSDSDSDRDDGHCDTSVDRAPALQFLPDAPPLAPPPAELPPVVPAGPGEPVAVDVTAIGGGSVPAGEHYAPPVLTAPIVVAPRPVAPTAVSGTAGTPRIDTRGTLPTASAPGPAPPVRQASPEVALANGAPAARLPASNQSAGRETVRTARVSDVAVNAMPGVAGLVLITACGICLGYRQAVAAQRQQRFGYDLLR